MTQNQKIIKNKMGLLNLAQTLGNVSDACKIFGYSRDSFYRFKELYETGGEQALQELSRKKLNLKNRVDPEIEQAVLSYAIDQPSHGQFRVSNELKKRSISVAAATVRNIWMRHNLEAFNKRLAALEAKMAQENLILTEDQLKALERKKEEQDAHGEIETEHPGYLGAQDTYYVGTIKGVGRIYQQTFIDTYSKVALAKLYDRRHALVAAEILNDRVVPFFEDHQIPLLRILTDRGTEYCGAREHHEYQLYLALEDIDHSRTKARHPQTNGICERFHKTIQQEFYQTAFRKKIYSTLEQLQSDLDSWIAYYNTERTHSGKMCCGRTPMQTFFDSLDMAKNKMLDNLHSADINVAA